MILFEVQINMLSGWENVWKDDLSEPLRFGTHREAQEELNDHLVTMQEAYIAGDIEDEPDPDEYRIVSVNVTSTGSYNNE